MDYISRHMEKRMLELSRQYSGILLTGPRQAGKTTMLSMLEHEMGNKAHYSHNANSAFGISFDLLGVKGVSKSKLRWFWLFFILFCF